MGKVYSLHSKPMIWIIGDSYVRRGRNQAYTVGLSLGLAVLVHWFGRGGLRWSQLVPYFQREAQRRSAPGVLLICCVSDDLGKIKSRRDETGPARPPQAVPIDKDRPVRNHRPLPVEGRRPGAD
ncbi:hypothetical protein WMY93_014129 [Mugilogobius chulae]|uniref:Uncharacterized protein n=1 Tax=Mugilogobius chulae TaxID=88201 RepID=A0AAW0P081_9GOBI